MSEIDTAARRVAQRLINDGPKDETETQKMRRYFYMVRNAMLYAPSCDRPEHVNAPKPKPAEATLCD